MAQKLDLNRLVPSGLQNETLASLVANLFNRFVSEESSLFVAGQVGKKDGVTAEIVAPDLDRELNALVPALYTKTATEENVYTWEDALSRLEGLGCDTDKLRTWLAEQYFNLAPPIDLDKFVNYTNYRWVGPQFKDGRAQMDWNPGAVPEYYVIAPPDATSTVKLSVDWAVEAGRPLALYGVDRPREKIRLTFTSSSTFQLTGDQDDWDNSVYGRPIFAIWDKNENGVVDYLEANTYAYYRPLAGPNVNVPFDDTPGKYREFIFCEPDVGTDFDTLDPQPLVKVRLVTGTTPFAPGDWIELDIVYLGSEYAITASASISLSGSGKGYITNVDQSVAKFAYIDQMLANGRRVAPGDRVLAWNQTDPAENGIYVARARKWLRANDANTAASFPDGTQVYVRYGLTNAGKLFQLAPKVGGFVLDTDPLIWNDLGVIPEGNRPTNDWQEYNFWYHEDVIANDEFLSSAESIQATRPIIEYSPEIQLNKFTTNGEPTETGSDISGSYRKTRFNQIPLFNLYRYDGTHSGHVGGIFYFEEDQDYPIDSALQRRAKTTSNSDFVFGFGVKDENGRLLYFKDGITTPTLKSIWAKGPTSAEMSPIAFTGGTNKGTLAVTLNALADNQTWTLTAVDATNFKVVGSRSGEVTSPTNYLIVGTPFTVLEELTLTVTAGVNPFVAGETFTFNTRNKVMPRYVKQLADKSVVTYEGGPQQDRLDNGEVTGLWLSPLRMFQNLGRELQGTVNYADLLNHFRSVMLSQDNFTGASFGDNNYYQLPSVDFGLGGSIREFDSNFPLLLSMLIQPNISPLGIIDFAEQQYRMAAASVEAFGTVELGNYIQNVAAIPVNTVSPNDPAIQAMVAAYTAQRAADVNLSAIFSDSEALVPNWPTTLPMLGLVPAVIPGIEADLELGVDVVVYHDGHRLPVITDNPDFIRSLMTRRWLRSDGTTSAGIFSTTAPTTPYARQLWQNTNTLEVFVFNVVADTPTAPAGQAGDFWYKRNTNQLYEWDVGASSWTLSASPVISRWQAFSPAAIQNSFILAIENLLYSSVHVARSQYSLDLNYDVQATAALPTSADEMEIELARFAMRYGYDTYASVYDAGDAFTWNYSLATIPGVNPGIARWFNLLEDYFDTFLGALVTPRPDLQPWKMLGYFNKPVGWDATHAATAVAVPALAVANCRTVGTTNVNPRSGLLTLNGVTLASGDRVLLVGQTTAAENGLYTASAGAWSRVDTIVQGRTVSITEGNYAGTTWVVTTANPITIDVTPLTIEQVRRWKQSMWNLIEATHPTLRYSVNKYTDALLPPYVSASAPAANKALTNTIPPSPESAYSFGDDGPIELIWKKSLEYNYGAARASFKVDALRFLDQSWGETYFHPYGDTVNFGNQFRVERNLTNSLPHKKFQLHGERLHLVPARTFTDNVSWGTITWTGGAEVRVTCSFVVNDRTFFDVYVNDTFVACIEEGGAAFTLNALNNLGTGVVITNLEIDDLGIPFNVGDTFTFNFNDDIVDPNYVPLDPLAGCEGCSVGGEAQVVPTIQVPYTTTVVTAQTKKLLGLGQWFTNLLRYSSVDMSLSDAVTAYRGWELKLAHRFGALMRSDSLTIKTPVGQLPDTAYNVLLKRHQNVNSRWYTALRIQLVEMGSRTLNKFGALVPKADGSDWVFRIEGYNSFNPVIEYYTYNTAGDFQTFFALQKASTDLAWKRYTERTALVTTALPITVTGLQNVINLVNGYTDRLNELGFKTNMAEYVITDAETGRNLDWQLEIEKLVDRVYTGMSAGQGHILNPYLKVLWLDTPTGIQSRFTEPTFTDAYVLQAAYDAAGETIPLRQLHVIRTDEQTATYSNTPIFSAHVFTDEFEHVLLLEQRISDETDSAAIFVPFLGAAMASAYLAYIRQRELNRKPTFNGFFLSGNDVKRNIVSGIDQIGYYYDSTQAFNESETARHATALLGFSKKSYFSNIDVTDAAQFNYWRGLIQAKGTNLTINAFVNYRKFNEAFVDEYWAYKLAEYGDARDNTLPEIKVNVADVSQRYAPFQFYDSTVGLDALPLFIPVEKNDDDRWFSIDDLGTVLRFEAQAISETVDATSFTNFPAYVRLQNIYHNGDTQGPTVSPNGATVIGANLLRVDALGTYTVTGYTWLNPVKFSPIKLLNYADSAFITDLALWHPAIGIHAYEPLQTINIIGSAEPGLFNYSVKQLDNVNFRPTRPWAKREVGRVWWDTSNLGYVPYYDATTFPTLQDRMARWGKLAEWASVDVYEWVESDVPPSEYDAKAAEEEGRSDIPVETRASGKAARQSLYRRERIVKVRPIAWSRATVGSPVSHPAFGPAEFTRVYNVGNVLYADVGRTEAINLTPGRHFGGWVLGNEALGIEDKPVGEVVIADEIVFNIGSEASLATPVITSDLDIELSVEVLNSQLFNTRLGAITMTARDFPSLESYTLRMSDSTGFYEDVDVMPWSGPIDELRYFDFQEFNLRVVAKKLTAADLTQSQVLAAMDARLTDVYVREGIRYTTLLSLPDTSAVGFAFINDPEDPDYSSSDYEWRTWTVPGQVQLNADLVEPKNSWKPYYGDWLDISVTSDVVADMEKSESSLTLRNGTVVNKYLTDWTDWVELLNVKVEKISNGVEQVIFNKSEFIANVDEVLDSRRLQLFVNGVQLNPNPSFGYVIGFDPVENEQIVQVVNTLAEGASVLLIYRAEQPTEEQLSFDPTVQEDLQVQVQYKKDFQYTVLEVRNDEGNVTGNKYYFWVKDKTTARREKNMSIAQATNILKAGPSAFALLARAVANGSSAAYDSCALAGLTRFVTKNDTYKLRFQRNFTLRDDPEQISLKNTHAEWTLLRRGQLTKIPEQLWNQLTDAVCGMDVGGNPLPSQQRVDYDDKHGTRTRFGFEQGQIFADTQLVRSSVLNTILNTRLVIRVGGQQIPDYISALNFAQSDSWFSTPENARITMNLIWSTARPRQINEIFFEALEDALANNYELSDIFKTSYITVQSSSTIPQVETGELDSVIF